MTVETITELDNKTAHGHPPVLNFTAFPHRQHCWRKDGDTRYYVQQAREYVLFPNPNVAAGLRAGRMPALSREGHQC